MQITPLFKDFGVRIDGVDPKGHASEELRVELKAVIREHKLAVINVADLESEDQVEFSKILGPINRRGVSMPDGKTHAFVSNERKDGFLRDGEIFFHSDMTYFDPPLKAISLYGITIPPVGGDTKFLDAVRAYERLPDDLKARIADLKAFHAHDYSENKYKGDSKGKVDLNRADAVSAVHPVVWTHPETGLPVLLVNRSQTQFIVDMDADESEALLNEIYSHVENEDNVYTHKWSVGDLVIWDNWSLQHARTEWDSNDKRTLRRVPIGPNALSEAA